MPKSRLVSYLKERELISKGVYLVRVNDSSVEVPSLQLVPIVKDF